MCTAVSYKTKCHYFGRNLDLDRTFRENVVITPRRFPFHFRMAGKLSEHYAMVGMAHVEQGYPLYYEASNEKGLSMAGLNFPDNAMYSSPAEGTLNLATFEFIPWILGRCADLSQAEMELENLTLVELDFSEKLPLSPLHWMISDSERSITVESVAEGLKIYDNPVGVLTNNPTFEYHMRNLVKYMALSTSAPENRAFSSLELKPDSLGMGAVGLPGDLSSSSRFVRSAFVLANSVSGGEEEESISQFFHILASVSQQRGCVVTDKGEYEQTQYSSCCNTDRGIYYYRSYENSRITAVDMHREDLESPELIIYPLMTKQDIRWQNG